VFNLQSWYLKLAGAISIVQYMGFLWQYHTNIRTGGNPLPNLSTRGGRGIISPALAERATYILEWMSQHQQFRETGATATTQRGDPFCVAQSSLDCRATSRYPALPRAIVISYYDRGPKPLLVR
jgi:hypothetical protein